MSGRRKLPLTQRRITRTAFLLLLFFGTLCSAMIIPYMGFFMVQSLGYSPWIISVYTVLVVGSASIANIQFARKIDQGGRAFPLIGLSAAGYAFAAACLWVVPSIWVVLTIGVIGFGLSSTAVSTMFSLGGHLAEQDRIERNRFNAHMRATTSVGWMIGPAIAFLIADLIDAEAVFAVALSASLLWLSLWWLVLPRDIAAPVEPQINTDEGGPASLRQLRMAVAFVFCLSLAHSLTFSSLPLFYVQEVGLPGYAPGLSFSIKTFFEVGAIFSTPFIIAQIGMYRALAATAIMAVIAIQFLANLQSLPEMVVAAALEGSYYGVFASLSISYVQSFATDRPAGATALYWNTIMVSGLVAGPAVGLIANVYDFQTVLYLGSGVALFSLLILIAGRHR